MYIIKNAQGEVTRTQTTRPGGDQFTVLLGLNRSEVAVILPKMDEGAVSDLLVVSGVKTETIFTPANVVLIMKKPYASFKEKNGATPLGLIAVYDHAKQDDVITVPVQEMKTEVHTVWYEGSRAELPTHLHPRPGCSNFFLTDEDAGRLDRLDAHKQVIRSIHNWPDVLTFINKHVVDEPINPQDLEDLQRDTIDIDAEIVAEKGNEPHVATQVMKKYDVANYMGRLYFKQPGEIYHTTGDALFRRHIFNELGASNLVKTRYVDEVFKQMEYRSPIVDGDEPFDIQLNNGRLRDGQFVESDAGKFTPYHIDVTYQKDAEPVQLVDDYLDDLSQGDESYRRLLLEMMAHTLIVDTEVKRALGKFFILVGDGANGKGTLLGVIRSILNAKNCSGISMEQLEDERYLTTIQGKLANLGDDVEDKPIKTQAMKMLKNISTCDVVSVRDLFKQSREVEMSTTLIFTSNHILKSFEKGKAYRRRVMWLPMYVKPKKVVKNFQKLITTDEALTYWTKLIVDAYVDLYDRMAFTQSDTVDNFNEDYHNENNNVMSYIQEREASFFTGVTSPVAYSWYEQWAEENGYNIQSKRLFVDTLDERLGLKLKPKKIDGRTMRVFVDEDGNYKPADGTRLEVKSNVVGMNQRHTTKDGRNVFE